MATTHLDESSDVKPSLSKPTVTVSSGEGGGATRPAMTTIPTMMTTMTTMAPGARPSFESEVLWRWVDGVMKREGGPAMMMSWKRSKGIDDPSEEFVDGIRLIRFIEALSGHRCPTPYHINPSGLDEYNCLDNLRMACRMLRAEGIDPGIRPDYLYHPGPQRLHLLEDLLWRMMFHFRLYRHMPNADASLRDDEEKHAIMKRHLLEWLREKTARHAESYRLKIEDLEHGFDDGYIYLILLHEFDPSIVTHEDLRHYSLPTQRANAMATATSLAKRHLGIPKILIGPGEGSSAIVSMERPNMAYLSEFWWKFRERDLQKSPFRSRDIYDQVR